VRDKCTPLVRVIQFEYSPKHDPVAGNDIAWRDGHGQFVDPIAWP